MTCHEFRSYFDDPQRGGLVAESAIITEHAALCSDCSRFLEEQPELAAATRLLRDSVPEVPGSLDVEVLAVYRRHINAEAKSAATTVAAGRTRFIPVLAWTAAFVVAILIASAEFGLLWPTEDAGTPWSRSVLLPAPIVSQSETHEVKPSPIPHLTHRHPRTAITQKKNPALPSSENQQIAAERSADSNSSASDPLPVGFRSLMYCDALSCGGPMQMIRVELPPAAAGLAPGTISTSEVVYADVLIGPDGIARGIRILK